VRVNDPDPPLTRWSQAKPRAGRRDKPVIEPTPNSGCDQVDRTAERSYRQALNMAIPTSKPKDTLRQPTHDPASPGLIYAKPTDAALASRPRPLSGQQAHPFAGAGAGEWPPSVAELSIPRREGGVVLGRPVSRVSVHPVRSCEPTRRYLPRLRTSLYRRRQGSPRKRTESLPRQSVRIVLLAEVSAASRPASPWRMWHT
jgi:hypothetical protein